MRKKSKRAYRGFLRNKLLGFGRYALWLINYRKDSDFYGIGKKLINDSFNRIIPDFSYCYIVV